MNTQSYDREQLTTRYWLFMLGKNTHAAKEYNPQEGEIILEIFEKISHSIASSIDDALLHVKE